MKNKQYRKKKTMAERADRHVQDVAEEYKFISKTFRKLRGRRPRHAREDFCGTANMCCEWVRRSRGNTAIGVDLDPEVLAWGRQYNLSRLKPDARLRVSLIQDDVCGVKTASPVDVVLAMNFSYQLFMTRKKLGGYFRKVRKALARDGMLFMDAFGGYDAHREIKEKRKYKGFSYIWEQAHYNPINYSRHSPMTGVCGVCRSCANFLTRPAFPGLLYIGRGLTQRPGREPVFIRRPPWVMLILAGFVSWWRKNNRFFYTGNLTTVCCKHDKVNRHQGA
jgi:hypothetical protein